MNRTNQPPLTQEQIQQQMIENDAAALAAEIFDHFSSATTMRQIFGLYRNMCDTINLRPGPLNEFYPKLKSKVKNWKAQALWKKFDARAAHRVYNKGTACNGIRVLVIGAGPCGLRTAIEAQLLGAKVVVVEKRDRISRNNVLHLWPFLITDLRNLGAKKFYGKFCAGAIDHISIRQLQCILLKVALLLGVEIHEGISFLKTIEPKDGCGWRAQVSPEDHAVSHYEFDVLIGADGKRNTLEGFRRKEFRGKLAIAITANFINKKTEAEARVEEISGVAFIFNQSFFKELYSTTGIDLENIVYYKDETHYFVMTAKKHSLLDKGVIIQDFADPYELLKPSNVNTERLSDYATEAAHFSTKYQMPNLEFAVNHYGKPDVAMFDFTSMFAAENSSRIFVRKNYRLLQCLVGDSLLEPFWPTGSGCARGFLSSMDAAYAIKLFANHNNSLLAVLAQRESIYRLLAQTTPENLQRDIGSYTLDPASRYPNLNRTAVTVYQVKQLLESDDPSLLEQTFMDTNTIPLTVETPARRKRRSDTIPLGTVLLRWVKSQLKGHEFAQDLTDVSQCFTTGQVLCYLINRYRPDLLDSSVIKQLTPEELNDHAFIILDKELGINRCMSAKDSMTLDNVDQKVWLNYLEQICEVFRGEIPHVKHPKLDFDELKDKPRTNNLADFSKLLKFSSKKPEPVIPASSVRRHHEEQREVRRSRRSVEQHQPAVGPEAPRRAKKRRTLDKTHIEERTKRLQEIDANRHDRHSKRREQRRRQTENFLTSLHMLQANTFLLESDSSTPFEDYSLYVYRQSAPMFNDRVKELEQKLLYPDRERGILSAMSRGGPDDQFSDRIKSMEQRIAGRHGTMADKKPKDLLRAIGKIESNDWNVKEIEKKIEASKKTEVGKNREKVPKWSREQFLARQNKLTRDRNGGDEKYREIDTTLKALDKQLKDPVLLERGERGKNKVASIAGNFVKKDDKEGTGSDEKEKTSTHKSSSSNKQVGLVLGNGASEVCHFCKQRVYLMEKITAEGLVLHRSCLKCHHCHTNLRLGGYAFDRDNPQGLFYCTQHYRLPAKPKSNAKRPVPRPSGSHQSHKNETDSKAKSETPSMIVDPVKTEMAKMDLLNRGQTPERIEFENADISDGEPSIDNVIDENEWTDRNFGTGTDASESDITSSTSESEDSESDFEEACGSPLGAQTLQLANEWIGKQRYMQESDEDDSYDTSEDDEADTQTEGEELAKARELRMQEVKLRPPLCPTTTDTETEAASDSDSSSPDVGLNSATEISTDSEFDLDPISKNPPQIYIDESYVKKPTRVQVRQGMIANGYGSRRYTSREAAIKESKEQDIYLKFKPLVQVDPTVLNTNITPLKNPRPGDYLLNKTASTEGIASKKSLELKKRYLLGEPNLGGGIMKSGSTSILDSKLRNFHSNISECQKLLNPGATTATVGAVSPTLQNLLKNPPKTLIGASESKANNNIDEKENLINNMKRVDDVGQRADLTETINTALVENKMKDLRERPIVETIDLTTSPDTKPIIDIGRIHIPAAVIKNNQEFIDNLDRNMSVIDLTGDTPVKDRSLTEQNENFATVPDIIKSNLSESAKIKIDQMFEEKAKKNDNDYEQRPRSPAHETSIPVPQIYTKGGGNGSIGGITKIESDSLSESSSQSSSTSSLDEIPHYILDSATSPDTQGEKFIPRVEIRDTTGELMQIDSLMIIDGKYVGDPEDLKLMEKLPEGTVVVDEKPSKVPGVVMSATNEVTAAAAAAAVAEQKEIQKRQEEVIREKCDINPKASLEKILKYEYKRPDLKFDTKNENKLDTLRNLPLIIPNPATVAAKEKPKNLKFADAPPTTTMIPSHHDFDKTPTVANPDPIGALKIVAGSVHASHQQDTDSETEVTGQALTETELSDWTADDAVSENFVDLEFVMNSNRGTVKRNKKAKKKSTGQTPVKHAVVVQSPNRTGGISKHIDLNDIEFMDTGSEDSCIETYATTNHVMLKNRGYVEFVDHQDNLTDYLNYKADPGYVSSPVSKVPNRSITTNTAGGYKSLVEAINKDVARIDFIEQGACILNNDFDLKTPMNEVPKSLIGSTTMSIAKFDENPCDIEDDSLLMITSQTTTTTEDSEALTVVTSPLESAPGAGSGKTESSSDFDQKLVDKTINNNHEKIEKVTATDDISYEDYVRQLQTQIREISSARDSLDMRKNRRKSSKGEEVSTHSQTASIGAANTTPTKTLSVFNSSILTTTASESPLIAPPTLSKKLEELTKERTKQKDLIHDLVMDKLQTKKQLNAEKRLNRSRNRNSVIFSPVPVSHNPNGGVFGESDQPIPPERRNSSKSRQEADRRHSMHLANTSAEKCTPVKDARPLSAVISPETPSKIMKTQSFCVGSSTASTPFSDFKTPAGVVDIDLIRSEARARARLKSNEDLGLSPEDKIQLLRKRYHIDMKNVVDATTMVANNKSDDMKFRERRMMASKSVNDITTVHQLATELRKSYIGKETAQSQPQTPKYTKTFEFASDFDLPAASGGVLSTQTTTSSSQNSINRTSPMSGGSGGGGKDRKGIIQTVSDFFHKKKEITPPKEQQTKNDLFGLFKISPRTKSKDKYIVTGDRSKSEVCLKYEKTGSLEKLDDIAPPIPPLPLNYQRSDDENYENHSLNDSRESKKFRSISKASRQGELKRLRIAQEIQREQEEIEVKIKELEAKGVELEKALRGEDLDPDRTTDKMKSIGANDENLVQDLLDIWRNITELKKRDEELSIRQKELQLEHRHAQLKEELNVRLSCNKLDKSSSDIAAEGAILNEMLEIVAKRAALRPNDTIATSKNDDFESNYTTFYHPWRSLWPHLSWGQTNHRRSTERTFSKNLFFYSKHRQIDFFKKPVFRYRNPETMNIHQNLQVVFLDQDNTSSLY